MNLEYLKTFRDIVRLGSFSEVAKRLSISQPAVSFQIQKLEQELGIRLIDRTQRAITLTAGGKRLLKFAESVDAESERLLRDLGDIREKVTGDLLIAASTIPGEYLLPTLLARFKLVHPGVRVQVDVSDSLTVINGLLDNTFEVGFCGMAPDRHDLESFRVAGDEIVLIVFPEHPFARKGEVAPADLNGEPLIYRESNSGTQRNLESRLAKAGLDLKKVAPALVLGSTQAVVSAVEDRAGIAFVSSLAIRNSLALGKVKTVNVSGFELSRDFYCIYRQERVVSRLLGEFISYTQIEAPRLNK